MSVLFIAWDGPDQSYLESLFLPIFRGLRERGIDVHVMQLRWGPERVVESARAAAERFGVPYVSVPIARKPKGLATAVTLVRGAAAIRTYARRHDIDVLMPRSTLPAAMALAVARMDGRRIVFDADGFAPDERVDFAGWSPTGFTYRAFRDVEALATRVAATVITRTSRGRSILVARAGAGLDPTKVHVIPNAKDEGLFHPGEEPSRQALRRELGVAADAPLLVHAGSLATHYHPDAMIDLLKLVRRKRSDAHLLWLTGQVDQAEAIVRSTDAPRRAMTVLRVAADDVPRYLAAADVGLAFRTASFSQQGVSPIKVGEYLLCGVPVLATRGVGDLDEQLAGDVAHLVERPTSEALAGAVEWMLAAVLPRRDALRKSCRDRGIEVFGLDRCIDRYEAALRAASEETARP